MLKYKPNKRFFSLILFFVIGILPCFITGNLSQNITQNANTENIKKDMQLLGTNVNKDFLVLSTQIQADLSLLTSSMEFRKLDIIGIGQKLRLLFYYHSDIYKNICVLDKNLNIIYGNDMDDVIKSSNKDYIHQALQGYPTSYYRLKNNIPQVFSAYPLFSPANNNSVVGVIIISLKTDYINNLVANINHFHDFMEAYIVDEEGIIITDSKYSSNTTSYVRIDIRKLKSHIEYEPNIPFANYRGVSCYGMYYDLPFANWTLVITADESNTAVKQIGIASTITSFSSGIGLVIAKLLSARNKTLLKNIEQVLEAELEDREETSEENACHEETSNNKS